MPKIGSRLAAVTTFSLLALGLSPRPALCVNPGYTIAQANGASSQSRVSPGGYYAVERGMEIHIVAPGRIEWPATYRDATEKYSGQLRLSADHRTIEGYVAGQPFLLLDPNDADVETK